MDFIYGLPPDSDLSCCIQLYLQAMHTVVHLYLQSMHTFVLTINAYSCTYKQCIQLYLQSMHKIVLKINTYS